MVPTIIILSSTAKRPPTVIVTPELTVNGPAALALVPLAIVQLVSAVALFILKISSSPLVVSPDAPEAPPKK